jgi:hypothetical protein
MLRICLLALFVLVKAGSQSEHIDLGNTFSKETFVYKFVGHTAIKADVYRLASQELRPVIIWIHSLNVPFSKFSKYR